jgi:hypothetical protein
VELHLRSFKEGLTQHNKSIKVQIILMQNMRTRCRKALEYMKRNLPPTARARRRYARSCQAQQGEMHRLKDEHPSMSVMVRAATTMIDLD